MDEVWPKTVWILGAGFSKPLGGPMLPQLLAHASFEDIAIRYKGRTWVQAWPLMAVRFLYHYGTRFRDGKLRGIASHPEGELMWGHAEEFLDRLDAAALSPGVASQMFQDLVAAHISGAKNLSVDAIRKLARRVVAAECTSFAIDGDPKSERWRPYVKWAEALLAFDTILTFNYDPVLEKLHALSPKFRFVVPGETDNDPDPEDGVPVYKLHGSVTWRRFDATRAEQQDDFEFATKCADDEIAIATPGPTKQNEVGQLLAPLWKSARGALRAADAVVFVGYRFPPSDAQARERLLAALWKNDQPHLDLHIVLGPNVDHEDILRLRTLLEYTMRNSGRLFGVEAEGLPEARTYTLRVHPLFAEDFFTVWRREQLHAGCTPVAGGAVSWRTP